jgi:hypothetical protein
MIGRFRNNCANSIAEVIGLDVRYHVMVSVAVSSHRGYFINVAIGDLVLVPR